MAEELPADYVWKNSYVVILDADTGKAVYELKEDDTNIYNLSIRQEKLLVTKLKHGGNEKWLEVIDLKSRVVLLNTLESIEHPVCDSINLFNRNKPSLFLDKSTLFAAFQLDRTYRDFLIASFNLPKKSLEWENRRPKNHSIRSLFEMDDSLIVFEKNMEYPPSKIYDGDVYSIDKITGEEKWSYSGNSIIAPEIYQPELYASTIVYPANQENATVLTGLNVKTGELEWEQELSQSTYFLRMNKKPLLISTLNRDGNKTLNAYNPDGGALLWSMNLDSYTPQICDIDDELYIYDNERVQRINNETGKVVWNKYVNNGQQFLHCAGQHLIVTRWQSSKDNAPLLLQLISRADGADINEFPYMGSIYAEIEAYGNELLLVSWTGRFDPTINRHSPSTINSISSDGTLNWKWDCPEGYKLINYHFEPEQKRMALTIGDPAVGVR